MVKDWNLSHLDRDQGKDDYSHYFSLTLYLTLYPSALGQVNKKIRDTYIAILSFMIYNTYIIKIYISYIIKDTSFVFYDIYIS